MFDPHTGSFMQSCMGTWGSYNGDTLLPMTPQAVLAQKHKIARQPDKIPSNKADNPVARTSRACCLWGLLWRKGTSGVSRSAG